MTKPANYLKRYADKYRASKGGKPSLEKISYFSSISFFTALNPSVCRR